MVEDEASPRTHSIPLQYLHAYLHVRGVNLWSYYIVGKFPELPMKEWQNDSNIHLNNQQGGARKQVILLYTPAKYKIDFLSGINLKKLWHRNPT